MDHQVATNLLLAAVFVVAFVQLFTGLLHAGQTLRAFERIERSTNIAADALTEVAPGLVAFTEKVLQAKRDRLLKRLADRMGDVVLGMLRSNPAVPAYRQPAPMHAPTQRFRTYPLNQGETAFVADLLTELIERSVAPEENGTSADYRKQARAMRDHMHATMRGWNPGCMAPDCEVCEPGHDGAK